MRLEISQRHTQPTENPAQSEHWKAAETEHGKQFKKKKLSTMQCVCQMHYLKYQQRCGHANPCWTVHHSQPLPTQASSPHRLLRGNTCCLIARYSSRLKTLHCAHWGRQLASLLPRGACRRPQHAWCKLPPADEALKQQHLSPPGHTRNNNSVNTLFHVFTTCYLWKNTS